MLAVGCESSPRTDVRGANGPGTRTLACHVALSPRLVGCASSRGPGAGCPPGWRPRGAQGALKARATGAPERGGVGSGEVDLERGAAVCAGALRLLAQQPHVSELPAPAGVCVEAAQETVVQGQH